VRGGILPRRRRRPHHVPLPPPAVLKGGPVPSLRLVALGSLALLGGCAARGGTPLPSPDAVRAGADPYATCWAADQGQGDAPTRCLREVESRLVAEAAGRARRSGARLELRAADTVIAEFADQAAEGEAFVRYRYGGWLARAAQHVV